MSYMSRNPQVASVVLDDITTTTPGNPPAGKHKIVDRMGNIFVRNSSGAETIIASAAGNSDGEKNYITNPSGAASISGWGTVDLLDIVRTATAAELPREFSTKTGLKITAKAGTTDATDYVYYDFTLDDVDDIGRIMKLKWDQKVTGTYTAGQLEVYIATQAARGTVAVTPFITAIPAQDGTFETYFLAPATATASLVIRCTADMATDGGIVISDVVVGPNVAVQGSAIGAWKTYTPIWSAAGTQPALGNGTLTGFYREVGDSIEARVSLVTGTTTSFGTGGFYFSIPAQYSFKSSAIPANALSHVLGLGVALVAATQNAYDGIVQYASPGNVYILTTDAATPIAWGAASPAAWAATTANQCIGINMVIPVNELSSNVTLANRSLEEFGASTTGTWDAAAVAGNTVLGPSGAPITGNLSATRAKVVQFQNSIQSTDRIVIEYQIAAGGPWIDQAESAAPFVSLPSISFGAYISAMTANTVTVSFSQYGSAGTTYNSATGATGWAATPIAWRLRKTSGGASVGYPISSANIVANTQTAAAGMVGEILPIAASGGQTITNATAYLSLAKTLTKGTWIVFATVGGVKNSATVLEFGISLNGNNTYDAGCVDGNGYGRASLAVESANFNGSTVRYFQVATDTPVYLNASSTGSATSVTGRMWAVHIA